MVRFGAWAGRLGAAMALAGSGLFAAPAWAETWVKVARIYVAPNRDAAMLRSLSVARIRGEDGETLEIELERALAAASYDGEPYFEIISPSRRRAVADATVSGGVTTRVDEQPFERTDKNCVEKVGKRCVRFEEVVVSCIQRVVTVSADVRITRNRDRRLVYTATHPRQGESRWCEGERRPGDVEEMIAAFLRDIAENVAVQIVPRLELQRVKVLEGTTGMPTPLAQRFRAAAQLAGRNLGAACGEWDAIAAEMPEHGSVLYDLGICSEAEGEYDRALDEYRRAAPFLQARDSEADKGIRRVSQTLEAMADLEARERREQGRPRGNDWRD